MIRRKSKTETSARAYAVWARDLKQEIGTCEVCLSIPSYVPYSRQALEIHHIGRGESKQAIRENRSCVLVVCWQCHDVIEGATIACPVCCEFGEVPAHSYLCPRCGVNRSVALWPIEQQLALLRLRREADFDVDLFNELVLKGRTRTLKQVDEGLEELRKRGAV